MLDRRVTLSKEVFLAVSQEIDRSADDLRTKARLFTEDEAEYPARGFTPQEVVRNCFPRILELVTPEWKETIFVLAARLVPNVLGEQQPDRLVEPIIPGLELPRWFSVPPQPNGTRSAGWVRDRDCSPDQLQRVINHRDADITGRQVERNKIVLLRATAIEEGCAIDQPIRTVFGDDV